MSDCEHCVSRRDFVRLSIGTTAAFGLASKFGLGWTQDTRVAKAKSMILLWMQGAPSQLDTFDPKPGRETGGPFKSIQAVPGMRISEHLPRLAKTGDDLSLIRTVNSRDPNHETAIYQLHTGYRFQPTERRPNLGCVVAKELGPEKFDLPAYVCFGLPLGPGFLGPEYAGFGIDKVESPLENVRLVDGIAKDRARAREALLHSHEAEFAKSHGSEELTDHRAAYENALEMVHSKRLHAFDISRESDKTRKAYGDTPFGKGCLTARRLVEADVPFVEVQLGDWDTHENNFKRTKDLMGQLDPAFASLIRDLKERDRLDETLIVCMGEFGRTPKINAKNGRDHFTKAWSVALAGGGVQGGRVIGRTDADGLEVAERPVPVHDLFATFYDLLGIDGEKKFETREQRPVKLLEEGTPVRELL